MLHDCQWNDEFPQDPAICYLNHAAVAPWPKRAAEAVKAFACENLHQGARDYPRWVQLEHRLRVNCRRCSTHPARAILLWSRTPPRPCPLSPWDWIGPRVTRC